MTRMDADKLPVDLVSFIGADHRYSRRCPVAKVQAWAPDLRKSEKSVDRSSFLTISRIGVRSVFHPWPASYQSIVALALAVAAVVGASSVRAQGFGRPFAAAIRGAAPKVEAGDAADGDDDGPRSVVLPDNGDMRR